jgi:uncharacterized protein YlxW (UPF0749 family)
LSFVFVIAWIFSVLFTILIGAGIITYVRRTWQLMQAGEDGSSQDQLLDSLDQIQTQLYSVSERLGRLERRLDSGDGDEQQRLSPGHVR